MRRFWAIAFGLCLTVLAAFDAGQLSAAGQAAAPGEAPALVGRVRPSAQLTRVGGGGLSPVDFACGATAGRIGNSIFDTRFSPAGRPLGLRAGRRGGGVQRRPGLGAGRPRVEHVHRADQRPDARDLHGHHHRDGRRPVTG